MIVFQTTSDCFSSNPIFCDVLNDTGRSVGIRHFCVTQPERLDVNGRVRRFMGSILYPAAGDSNAPARIIDVLSPRCKQALEFLLQNASAGEAAFLRERLPRLALRARREAPVAQNTHGYPILLFNPGGESSRAACLPLGEMLAAAGYIVLALDGVRDSPAQIFPDGEINSPPLLPGESPIDPRIADMRFLLDLLPTLNAQGPLGKCFDLGRVGTLGHSRGGYLANIAAVEDNRINAAVNMDGFLWGLWTEGTGLKKYPVDFQERAHAMRTPILRLTGEQRDPAAARKRFALESQDFGGPFWFATLQGFEHTHFSSAPFICINPSDSIAALDRMEEYRQSVQVLAPILTGFFDATLREMPLDKRMNVRASDFFAAKPPGLELP